jgi:hypothetical protein
MLRTLLNFWLFPIFGMMFAAGAVLDAGAMGGGDGGSTSDSGTTGNDSDGEVSSEGDEKTSVGENDSTNTELSDGESEGQSERDANDVHNAAIDTKGFTAEDKKLIDLAQKAGPKEAQRIKQLVFAEKRLLKVVPGGVKGVVELVRAVEEFGGIEGVQQLQSEIADSKADGEMFQRADPRWVESGFERNPESALKLFAHTLDFVSEKHPEHYNHLMAKVIKNDLDSSLPVREMHALLVSLKDNPQAQELAKKLANYYNGRNDLAQKVPEKKVDAQQKALTDREAKINEREMGVRYTQVNEQTFPALKAVVGNTLRSEMKLDGLDIDKLSKEYPAEWRNLLNEIHQQVKDAAVKDKRFIENYVKRVRSGDVKRAAELTKQKHDAIAPDIARKVRATYGVFRKKANAKPNANASTDKGNGNANANSGWSRVSARPAQGSIDWSKTTQSMQLDGKYILTDGKKVVVVY